MSASSSTMRSPATGESLRRLAVALALAPAAPLCASIDFTETYDTFGTASKVTVQFDFNNDFVNDATFTSALHGRVDVELRLREAAAGAPLEALRVRRLSLFAEPTVQFAAGGFSGTAHDVSLHMGDGLGSAAGNAQIGWRLGTDIFTWTQPGPCACAASGTARGSGPNETAELLDLAQLDPFTINGFSGEWEWRAFGSQTRFRLTYQSTQNLNLIVPIRTTISVVIEETRPFIVPATPIGFDEWIAANGLAGAAAGPLADPDTDGRTNLDEFAFSLDPRSADGAPPPITVDHDGGVAEYAFIRDTTRDGIEYHVQSSRDLVTWKTIAAALPGADALGTGGGVVLEEQSLGGGRYRVVIRDPTLSLQDPQRFARLEIVRH